MKEHRYEILDGLPAYGPMYVPVSDDGEQFYSEGLVVRFFKSDGTGWVANFKPGWTDLDLVMGFQDTDRMIVIAKGQGYLMTPDQQMPIDTFGPGIKTAIQMKDNKIIFVNDIHVQVIDSNGTIWQSQRISWDGIKDLTLQDNILTGLSYDPTNSADAWVPFSVDLDTRQVTGGSYNHNG